MSLWTPSKRLPKRIRPTARNGELVGVTHWSNAALKNNHIAAYRKKWIASFSQPVGSVATGTSGSFASWRTYFRTGHQTSSVDVRLTFATCDAGPGSGVSDPYVNVALINPTTLLVVDSADIHNGVIDPSVVDSWDTFFPAYASLAANPDTAYLLQLTVYDFARVVAMEANEAGSSTVDDSNGGAVPATGYSVDSPIYDSQLLVAASLDELLRSNRHHLVSFAHYDGTGPNVASASYTNAIDASSTTVSTATPGFYITNTCCNTVSRSDVPIVVAYHAERTTAFNSGYACISDGSTNYAEVTGIISAGWYVGTDTIPANSSPTKYDPWIKCSTGVRLNAIAILEYE